MTRLAEPVRSVTLRLGMVVVLLVGLAGVSGQVRAEEDDLTDHLTLLGDLGRAAAEDLVDQLGFPPGSDVHLIPETAHPANWFVGQLLAQTLRNRGYGVVQPTLGAGPLGPDTGGAAQPAKGPQAGGQPQGEASQQSAGPQTSPPVEDSSEDEESGEDDADDEDADADLDEDETGTDSGEADQEETDEDEPQQNNQPAPQQNNQGGANQQQGQGPQGPGQGNQGPQGQAASQLPKDLMLDLPDRGEICSFRVVECGVSYPWVRRSWFVGPRTFGRYASVRLRGSRVSQPGKRIASVGGSDQVSVDKFPGWAKPYLEGDEYPFPLEQPPGMAVERLAEPVIVAAIVGGLVYLFSQNQK